MPLSHSPRSVITTDMIKGGCGGGVWGWGMGGMHQKAIFCLLLIPVEHLKVLMTDYCIHKFIIDRNCTTNIAWLISE